MQGRTRTRWRTSAISTLVAAAVVGVAGAPLASAAPSGGDVEVIVRYQPGGRAGTLDAIDDAGGRVVDELELINSLSAEVPAGSVATLEAADGLDAVTPDAKVRLHAPGPKEKWKPDVDMGSFYMVTKGISAHDVWGRSDSAGTKYTGQGIGVAVIDSGVVPVDGLTAPGKVINGADLSFESQSAETRYLDGFGHGTHMAGIIAGREASVQLGNENDSTKFVGVAPGAHIINVKVAGSDGATDVSQVIAGIDWVVEHRDDPGLNIKVLNLSFGTTALQPYQADPLVYAVEQAWHKGIVVVVAAGNDGPQGTTLTNPAIDPYVIAVGAADHAGTEGREDDTLASFSSVGNTTRVPDLIAPGRSIVSLRSPGSWVDERYPDGRVTERFFRGSGTSQAAAVVSGAVALVLDEQPKLTPDQVKFVLKRNAVKVRNGGAAQGAGQLQLKDIQRIPVKRAPRQAFARSTGTGSLESARGGAHVADPETGVELVGEADIFGRPWNGEAHAAEAANEVAWNGGAWNGTVWTGPAWDGASWTGKTWRSETWTSGTWTGKTWRAELWTGKTWRGATWTGKTWRDATWTGKTWRGGAWAGAVWR